MNTHKTRMVALVLAVCMPGAAQGAITWNGTSWTGTNYDNITIDRSYYGDPGHAPVANLSSVVNYGTITVPVGISLDFGGTNFGTITNNGLGFSIWSGVNYGTLEGAQVSLIGSFQNNHTMNFDTLGASSAFTNNGSISVSSQFGAAEFVNYGTANLGTYSGDYFENAATASFTATTLNLANIQNSGTGIVSGSITAGVLNNRGTLSADSLTITHFGPQSGNTAALNILSGSIAVTGSVNLHLIGSAGFSPAKSTIDGTLTVGQGVFVGSDPDHYPFTLGGIGEVNGDVFINKNGTLDPRLTINGTVIYWAPPPALVVPEPETYAMLLAGLAMMMVATRRKNRSPL